MTEEDEQVVSVRGASGQIRAAVLTWEGVEYRLHKREIGHVHGNRLVDLPLPKPIRDELVAAGLAEPHHIRPQSGWVSFYIRQPADIERAIGLLRRSYELAVVQQHEREAP